MQLVEETIADIIRPELQKDGGDIDQITGATISPRAVVYAVDEELKRFSEKREEILEKAKLIGDGGDENAPSGG